MRSLIVLLILIGLIDISACQNVKHIQLNHSWTELNTWSLSGKLAINNGKDSGSGNFDWKMTPAQFAAQFKAPLGQGSWKITEDHNQAHLVSSQHPDKFADNAQQLIANELGWSFPIEKLKYWLRGYQYLQKQEKHTQPINNINDGDWHITYQKWQNTPMGLLPTKIKASKPPYSIKLIIYHWDFD